MTIIVGTTNTDGSGSAANLTAENGLEITEDMFNENPNAVSWEDSDGYYSYEDTQGYYSNDFYFQITSNRNSVSYTIENTSEWNADDLKEIYITNVYTSTGTLTIENFVDVYLAPYQNQSGSYDVTEDEDFNYVGGNIYWILYAKRGVIDTTSEGDEINYFDRVLIVPKSNGDSWSNLFDITTGSGNDTVAMIGSYCSDYDYDIDTSSTYTEFTIDLGADNDEFRYSLEVANSNDQLRYVDGGTGTDLIALYRDTSDLDFDNFEIITNYSDSDVTLTITEEQLADNASSDEGLIIDAVDIEFAEDYDAIVVSELTDAQVEYIEQQYDEIWESTDTDDYYAVTVTYGDNTYTLLTNDVDSDWLTAA